MLSLLELCLKKLGGLRQSNYRYQTLDKLTTMNLQLKLTWAQWALRDSNLELILKS